MKNKKSMLKRAFSILLCMAVFFTAIPGLEAFADDGETTATPEISIQSQTVRAGEYTTVYVQANNFSNVGALELAVYYDNTALQMNGTWNGWLVDGAVTDINDSTAGTVKMSLVSVEGINGTGDLLGITFYAKKEASLGPSQLKLVVTGAYDLEGNTINLNRTSGAINIKAPLSNLMKVEFGAYFYNYQVEEGQELTYVIQSYEIDDFAGGEFKVEYDADIMQVADVVFCEPMLQNSPTYSVNDSTPGIVHISYANSHAIMHNWHELIRITFKTKAPTDYSEIKLIPSGLVGEDLQPMSSNTSTTSFSVTAKPASDGSPDFILTGGDSVEAGQSISITAAVPGASKISAGDFVISYNKNYMVCTSVTVDDELSAAGGIVVTKEDIENGTVKFSYVNMKPTGKDTELVHMTFKAKTGVKGNTTISARGKDLVDTDYKDITLNYPSKTVKITACVHTYGDWIVTKEATCTANGSRYKVCSKCSNEVKENISATGHDMVYDNEKPATCTQPGYTSGGYCKKCDHKVPAGEIPAYGHNYDDGVITKEPTEDMSGIMTFTCTRCGDKRTNEIPPLSSGVCRHENIEYWEGYDATCTSSGLTMGAYCTICWEVLIPQQMIPAYGHNYDAGHITQQPTATEPGMMTFTCINCGDRYHIDIPASGDGGCAHYNILTLDRVDPTCVDTGLTEGRQCMDCGSVIIPQTIIEMKAHNTYKSEYTPATCTTDGCEQYWQCLDCGGLFGDVFCSWQYSELPVISATGHTYNTVYGWAATCTSTGLTDYIYCVNCGMVKQEQKVIDFTEHHSVVIPGAEPTCHSIGLTEGRYCDICGSILKAQNTRAKTSHKYGSWKVSSRATVSGPGQQYQECSKCRVRKIQKIARIKKTTLSKTLYNYDGKVKKPVVTVVDYNNAKLKAGTDYTVTIRNASGKIVTAPKAVGKYKVTVTFKGKYKGTVNKWYTVNPKVTKINKLTKPAKKQIKVTWQKRTVQVTGYQIRYSTKQNMNGSKMITIKNYKTNNRVIKNLKAKKKYWVQVRTYKTVNGKKYFSAWSIKKSVKTK